MSTFDVHDHADILYQDRPVSTHPKMGRLERAAQFMPFAALTGYDEAIEESGREVECRHELSDEEKQVIDQRLRFLLEHKQESPSFRLTYFIPDGIKEGGRYEIRTVVFRDWDPITKVLILKDRTRIALDDVYQVQGELFEALETII